LEENILQAGSRFLYQPEEIPYCRYIYSLMTNYTLLVFKFIIVEVCAFDGKRIDYWLITLYATVLVTGQSTHGTIHAQN